MSTATPERPLAVLQREPDGGGRFRPVLAVAGNGGVLGAYTLETRLMVGYVDNPAGQHAFQSGLGVVSGRVCEAERVEIGFETAQGAVLRFGDGEHTVLAYADGTEFGRAVVRVTTVGDGAAAEFLRAAAGECVVADFPAEG